MERPRHRSLSVLDFLKWDQSGELLISPKFQRRAMWPPKARSFLIDTILRGFPIPKLYMRQHLDLENTRTIHEVVDGQQRIRAVLDFYNGEYKISRAHGPFGGYSYATLDRVTQQAFLGYEFSVDLLVGASDADVLNIFARINSYSAPLNAQEKRNARFFGAFKQLAYELSYEHLEFWKSHKILTDQGIARMREAELTSELLVAMSEGLQDKKTSLDKYYEKWDDAYPKAHSAEAHFRDTIDLIEDVVGDDLQETIFHRPALFYSLFLACYALRFGMDGRAPDRKAVSKSRAPAVRNALRSLSAAVSAEHPPRRLAAFVEATQRQTDNIGPRRIRHQTLISSLAS